MSSENNKAVVRRWIEEVWNSRNLAAIHDFIASNHVLHDRNTPDSVRGPEGARMHAEVYLTAFPDSRFTIEDIVAEGDRVVTRWTVRATHSRELQGLAPTNKPVAITGITMYRCENGKIVESFLQWDALELMQQLGALTQLAAAKAAQRG